jgi:hypothetical protein
MTDEELRRMTSAQRSEWIDSLSADEKLILNCPPGYLWMIIMASWVKHWLVTVKMTTEERLEILEKLNGLTDEKFTAEALATIKPANDISVQMIEEARKLDDAGDLSRSFDVLVGWETFGHLVRLNPSILDAIKLMPGHTALAQR